MNKLFKLSMICTAVISTLFTACTKDLDRLPNNGLFADNVYTNAAGYKSALAKVYSTLALTGSNGPGSTDLSGIDAGLSDFFRMFWNLQELTSDEGICAWINDPGIYDLDISQWTASNALVGGLYNRSLYSVTVANSFLKESAPDVVAGRGITGADAEEIKHYAAEARFLRAYQYWVLMDLYGNPPFVTENDPIGSFVPPRISRTDLFDYIESQLKNIEPDLVAPQQNEYGRADQAADWALLARMYLNAEVYTGTAHYSDALTYSKKVLDAGYQLKPTFREIFYADNNVNNTEVIFPINYDAANTQSYGGTTFLVNSSINGDMDPASFGVPTGGWGGNRAKPTLPNLFADQSGSTDSRALFYGTKKEVDKVDEFTDGLRVTKFRNINSDGTVPADAGTFCSIDFPLFRLAEMNLIYAESFLRNGGGDKTTALQYFNALRERAYGNTTGDVSDIVLDDMLNERGKELCWEGSRRTDLIRFGKYTGSSYLWQWKGGVKDGTGIDSHFNLFPIPSTDLVANPNLIQNPGY